MKYTPICKYKRFTARSHTTAPGPQFLKNATQTSICSHPLTLKGTYEDIMPYCYIPVCLKRVLLSTDILRLKVKCGALRTALDVYGIRHVRCNVSAWRLLSEVSGVLTCLQCPQCWLSCSKSALSAYYLQLQPSRTFLSQ